jgi:hypothetical protein
MNQLTDELGRFPDVCKRFNGTLTCVDGGTKLLGKDEDLKVKKRLPLFTIGPFTTAGLKYHAH